MDLEKYDQSVSAINKKRQILSFEVVVLVYFDGGLF